MTFQRIKILDESQVFQVEPSVVQGLLDFIGRRRFPLI